MATFVGKKTFLTIAAATAKAKITNETTSVVPFVPLKTESAVLCASTVGKGSVKTKETKLHFKIHCVGCSLRTQRSRNRVESNTINFTSFTLLCSI